MQATIEAGFSGYVSNIRASTKKSIAYKKKCVPSSAAVAESGQRNSQLHKSIF